LRKKITVLFQEPVHYNASVAENISLSESAPDGTVGAHARDRCRGARRRRGRTDWAHLPAAYETLLGNWFAGGVELSVGEWQRLALARAFPASGAGDRPRRADQRNGFVGGGRVDGALPDAGGPGGRPSSSRIDLRRRCRPM
jgi:hypothetical protein